MNGGPWNDRWVNTTTVPKLREQLNLAYQSGINRIWIINVGDLKPKEMPISFIMDYAWYGPESVKPLSCKENALFGDEREWLRQWTASVLGGNNDDMIHLGTKADTSKGLSSDITDECADIISTYSKLNLMRKPEVQYLGLFNYEEMLHLNNQWQSLVLRCEAVKDKIPAETQDAFYQLVYYPAVASAGVAMMYNAATMGDSLTVNYLMDKDRRLTEYYNKAMAGGKWDGMMLDNHIGYTQWSIPEKNRHPMTLGIKVNHDLGSWKNTKEYSIDAPELLCKDDGWIVLDGLGRGEGSMGAKDVMRPSDESGNGPALECEINLNEDGKIAIGILPTQDIMPARGLRIGVQLDDQPMRTIDARQGLHDEFQEYTPKNLTVSKVLKPLPQRNSLSLSGFVGGRRQPRRTEVFDNIRWLEVKFDNVIPGSHKLKIIMIDPGVVVDELVVNPDNNRYSYLGAGYQWK